MSVVTFWCFLPSGEELLLYTLLLQPLLMASALFCAQAGAPDPTSLNMAQALQLIACLYSRELVTS